MEYFDILIGILGSAIRLSIPLLFTALAGLFSERAGIFDIGLEGKMLVSAFAGYDHVMAAYREAVARRYRFYSYGDAMFLTRKQ